MKSTKYDACHKFLSKIWVLELEMVFFYYFTRFEFVGLSMMIDGEFLVEPSDKQTGHISWFCWVPQSSCAHAAVLSEVRMRLDVFLLSF